MTNDDLKNMYASTSSLMRECDTGEQRIQVMLSTILELLFEAVRRLPEGAADGSV